MSATTDGGGVAELTAFQQDLLRALAKTDEQSGLLLKTDLSTYYGEAINHSQLCQILDELGAHGLINKRQRDAWIRGETA